LIERQIEALLAPCPTEGFHRIRHYGLLASATGKANIARAKELMAAPMPAVGPPAAHDPADPDAATGHRPPPALAAEGAIDETRRRRRR